MDNLEANVCNNTINNGGGKLSITNKTAIIYRRRSPISSRSRKSCPVKLPFRFNVPDPVVNFTGRKAELRRLHDLLQNGSVTILSQFATICGLGGIGKTETVKMYASEYGRDYDIILYIVAENETTFVSTVCRIAGVFSIQIKYNEREKDGKASEVCKPMEEIVHELYQCCAFGGTSLIIFDNVDEQRNIIKYLPRKSILGNRPKVIITSRKRDWTFDDYENIETIQLGVFDSQTALEYVEKSLEKQFYHEEDVKKLCQLVGYLPLALKLAIAFVKKQNRKFHINKTLYAIEDYIRECECSTRWTLLEYVNGNDDVYGSSLSNTWRMTTAKIRNEYENIGIRAIEILEWIAYLLPDNISCHHIFQIDKDKRSEDAICLLEEYSMIDVKRGEISVHRLVQEVTKKDVKESKREEILLQEIIQALNVSSFDIIKVSNIYENIYLKPHLSALWEVACHNDYILSEHYYKVKYSPLKLILEQKNPDIIAIKVLSNYEYDSGKYANIAESLLFAVRNENLNAVEHFIELLDNCSYSYDLNELLCYAIIYRNTKNAIFFANKCSNTNIVVGKYKKSPLMLACECRLKNVVICLLAKKNCNVNLINDHGQSALFLACESGDLEIIKVLMIRSELNINLQDNFGRTALIHACRFNNLEVIKILLNSDELNLNIQDYSGYTALMIACRRKNLPIVKILIKSNKLDLNVQDKCGATTLMNQCKDLSRSKDLGVFKALIESDKLNLNLQDTRGMTALMIACEHENLEMVKIIIGSNKTDLKMQDKRGWTALMYASAYKNLNIIDMVLTSSVSSANIQDKFGQTVLHQATLLSDIKKYDILKILIKYCDPKIKDHSGRTPLDYCFRHNDINSIAILNE